MHVMVLGLRGFPNVQGGVETHASYLYPRVVKEGVDVEIIARAPYLPEEQVEWEGVRFTRLWSPQSTGLEAMLHSVLGVFYAGVKRPDLLHIHAIGPSIVTPLARLLGIKVVTTHHGPDYDREKWGKFARWLLRTGEKMGAKFSQRSIVISDVIAQILKRNYAVDSTNIPNGVELPELEPPGETLQALDVAAKRYVLLVSRLVPEKRHLDLIEAFERADMEGWKLVLVGGIDGKDSYTAEVKQAADQSQAVVLAGFQTGQALAEIYSNAGIFVLPSSHEGLPIALLEALSYGLPIVASDIPAHLEIDIPDESYFPLGDVEALSRRLIAHESSAGDKEAADARRQFVAQYYNWDAITKSTVSVYRDVIKGVKYAPAG